MNNPPLILAVGEILWDLLPAGKELGGAPANFAYHAAQLGADAKIISAVGEDAFGHEILHRLPEIALETSHVAIDARHPTGTVSVSLDSTGVPTYTIHEDVAWDFIPESRQAFALADSAHCVCFGSLAQRGPVSRRTIRQIVSRTPPRTLRVFDINLRQQYYEHDTIDYSLGLADVLKINDSEIHDVARLLGLSTPNQNPAAPAHVQQLFARYHQLNLIALTRGPAGSVLYARDGAVAEHPGYPAEPLADTVGAGDAFTAALALGLLKDLPLSRINEDANRLASHVCTQSGATPNIPRNLLRELSVAWP